MKYGSHHTQFVVKIDGFSDTRKRKGIQNGIYYNTNIPLYISIFILEKSIRDCCLRWIYQNYSKLQKKPRRGYWDWQWIRKKFEVHWKMLLGKIKQVAKYNYIRYLFLPETHTLTVLIDHNSSIGLSFLFSPLVPHFYCVYWYRSHRYPIYSGLLSAVIYAHPNNIS